MKKKSSILLSKKLLIICSFLHLMVNLANAQDGIEKYFIPLKSSFNKSSYYSLNSTGQISNIKRIIYYVSKGNNIYELTDAKFMGSKAMSVETKTIQITSTEIKLLRISTASAAFSGNQKKTYQPAVILLKLPKAGQNISWMIPGEGGDKPTKCMASWTVMDIDGEKRKAIKLISHPLDLKSKIISYYIMGVGLTDTNIMNESGVVRSFEKFEEVSYEDLGT